MTRVLGIDPGSRITGFGVVDQDARQFKFVACGAIKLGGGPIPERLGQIFIEISKVIAEYAPSEVAIEQVFMSRNADAALKLGQARGAAICAAVTQEREVAEYSARQIKQAVVGTGAADKSQVQHMVSMLLQLEKKPQADAADALAVALCHMQVKQIQNKIPAITGSVRGRWR